MGKSKRISLWVTGVVGVLLFILFALLLVAPKIVNLEPVREKVVTAFYEKLGGKIEFQRLDLSIFPKPHVVVHQTSLSIPTKANGTLESLKVYPKILPLLRGKLQLAKVQAETPYFKMRLPKRPETAQGETQGVLAGLLAPLALNAPDLIVELKNGRLDLSEKKEPLFSFSNIDARIVFPPSGLKIDISSASNLWERIVVKVTLDSDNLKGKGRVDLTHFRPHKLTNYLFPFAPQHLSDSKVNLSFEFKMDGLRVLQAEVEGSLPYLVFHRRNEKLVIKGKNVKSSFQMDEKKIAVSLNELNLDFPQLTMSGKFLIDRTPPQVSLELEGREVDVHSTREVALALAGDVTDVQEIFGVVRGGKVPLITLKAQGSSFADLGDLENILIEGSMVEGKIFIPDVPLDLEDAKGNVLISKGILEGENLEANLGNSRGHEGRLKLGLEGENAPFHLDIKVQADLAQLPPILKRLVDDKGFLQEIGLIEDLKGNAKGKLILGESTEAVKLGVDVSEFELATKYQRIPYPLKISGGHFSYGGTKIDVKNLSGNLGKSSFSQLSAGLDSGKEHYLEVKSGKVDVLLDEIYPWLTSLEGSPFRLEDIKSMKGHVHLTEMHLEVPLLSPKKWQAKTSLEPRDVVIDSTLLPGPIEITKGRFDSLLNLEKQKSSFRDVQVSLLDASMNLSGAIYDYFKGLNKVDASLHGVVGPESDRWMTKLLRLPTMLALRPPFSISEGHLLWEKNAKTSFKANLAVQEGPNASIDIFVSPEETRLTKLLIQDEVSQASMAFDLKERELSLRFTGNLEKRTLNNLFAKSDFVHGRIEGDFRARISLDELMKSTAQGRLTGQDLILPYYLNIPLEIDKIALNAEKGHVDVEQVVLVSGGKKMDFKGDVDFSSTGLVFDMGLDTDGITWTEMEKLMGKDNGKREDNVEKEVRQGKGLYDFPIQGTLKLRSAFLNYDRFTWFPFDADITFDPDEINIAIIEAELCGISTPGALKITPREILLDFDLASRNQELNPTALCLSGKQTDITGSFDLLGRITGRGKGDQLGESLKGAIEFTATDGRIRRHMPLQKVFAYLNLTESLRGKLPDMSKEEFPYKSITAKGNMQNGKFILNEGIIDTPSVEIIGHGDLDLFNQKIDLTLLVAPLKTLDWFIKKIPLVNGILQGTLVAIPVKVEGDVADPTVKKLSASAAGSRLLGIMKRTVKLPFEVIDPVLPKGGEKPVETKP